MLSLNLKLNSLPKSVFIHQSKKKISHKYCSLPHTITAPPPTPLSVYLSLFLFQCVGIKFSFFIQSFIHQNDGAFVQRIILYDNLICANSMRHARALATSSTELCIIILSCVQNIANEIERIKWRNYSSSTKKYFGHDMEWKGGPQLLKIW